MHAHNFGWPNQPHAPTTFAQGVGRGLEAGDLEARTSRSHT